MFKPKDRVKSIVDDDPDGVWKEFRPLKIGELGTVREQDGEHVLVQFDGWGSPCRVLENTIKLVSKKKQPNG